MRDTHLRTGLPLMLHIGAGCLLLIRWTRLEAQMGQSRLVLRHAKVVEHLWLLITSRVCLYLMRMLLPVIP